MNPLLKFIVKRLESKIADLKNHQGSFDEVDGICEDIEVYFEELKQIVGDVVL